MDFKFTLRNGRYFVAGAEIYRLFFACAAPVIRVEQTEKNVRQHAENRKIKLK